MPARTITTARQERLGAELRKLRERAGMTIREAARATGIDQTKISHTEAGRVGVSGDRARHFATRYLCDDSVLVDALVDMAVERGHGWWEEYREVLPDGFLDLAELEYHATFLRTIEISHIPGIMQTEDQVRAVYSFSVPELSKSELEARVAHRLRRRVVFDREPPPECDIVIHEAALRIRVGDRKVARAQLAYLLSESERTNVSLRVVPFDVDGFGAHPMLYAGGPVRQLDTVHLDTAHGGTFLSAESQLHKYETVFRRALRSALGTEASRDLMRRVARDM
ncbi:helix-turn-helix transcriptional regulator [Streptomyces sp. NPDC048483]|uniref:helix-turn-helix domain-containing protein n=1 Tax=Streptomyces sp. NPDC048483 TaxID=3154927 RepID=UPI00344002E7